MRNRIFFESFPQRWRISLLAVLFVIAGTGASALQAGSITGYRDANGRVVFVNESNSDSATSPAPSQTAQPSGAVSPDSGHTSSLPIARRRETIASTALSSKDAPPVAASVSAGGFEQSWNEIIEWTASRHQVDPALVRAIVQVESNFNPRAVSRRGAGGLMQLIPATARRFGVSNVFDPEANLDGGVRYLKYLMNQFGGDLKLSLAAYNAGENAVGRHNGVPPFPETQDYIRKIAQLYPLSAPKPGEPSIQRYVDGTGIVHFSNTDMP